jgi:hypothetical protein
MTDHTAEMARLMKVVDAVIEELERQGVLDFVADEGFDPMAMAKAGHQGRRRRCRPVSWPPFLSQFPKHLRAIHRMIRP